MKKTIGKGYKLIKLGGFTVAEEKVYAIGDSGSREETMTKEQIEKTKQNTVLSGTTKPTSNMGKDGDLYVLLEE